jgi:4-amino-4-deoxy-L-arabinose transferase-like glycosyltransferase
MFEAFSPSSLSPRTARRWRAVAIGALAVVVFLGWLGRRDIVTSHEGRVVQTARTMAEAGWPWQSPRGEAKRVDSYQVQHVNPWVIPVIQGQIRLQKPPLPYWCAAVLFRAIGFNETAARLTPALMGAAATFLVWSFAQQLYGRRIGLMSALAWVSTMFVAQEFRMAMADPPLAFFTLLCAWAWVTARDRRGLIIVFYLSLALGVLAKGPLIFVHVAIALACYHVCFRKRPPGSIWVHLIGLVAFVAIALPWPISVLRALPEARQIWISESVAQLSEVSDQHRPWHFYAPQWLLMALPWTPILIWGLILRARKCRSLRPWFPLLWFVATVMFFSLVDMKKNAYLLPAAPALVMLTGQSLATTLAWLRRERFAKGAEALAIAMGLIGVGWGVATCIYAGRQHESSGIAAALIATIISVAPLLLVLRRNVDAQRWLWRQAIAFAIVWCTYDAVWRTGRENARSPSRAGEAAMQIAAATGGTIELPAGLPHVAVYVSTGRASLPGTVSTVAITEGVPTSPRWRDEWVPAVNLQGPWQVWRRRP